MSVHFILIAVITFFYQWISAKISMEEPLQQWNSFDLIFNQRCGNKPWQCALFGLRAVKKVTQMQFSVCFCRQP